MSGWSGPHDAAQDCENNWIAGLRSFDRVLWPRRLCGLERFQVSGVSRMAGSRKLRGCTRNDVDNRDFDCGDRSYRSVDSSAVLTADPGQLKKD